MSWKSTVILPSTSSPIIKFLFTILENNFSADLIFIESNLSVTGTVSKFLIGKFKSMISLDYFYPSDIVG